MAYINRENLIQLLANENSNIEVGRQYYGAIYQKVMNMPTADVAEVKHGEWKEPMDELKIFKGRYLICSQCNVMLPIITELAAYYYCPNCGAKMDKGEINNEK